METADSADRLRFHLRIPAYEQRLCAKISFFCAICMAKKTAPENIQNLQSPEGTRKLIEYIHTFEDRESNMNVFFYVKW